METVCSTVPIELAPSDGELRHLLERTHVDLARRHACQVDVAQQQRSVRPPLASDVDAVPLLPPPPPDRRWRLDASARSVPCRVWCGPKQVRYRGRRWLPRRLFFALGVDGARERLALRNSVLTSLCGNDQCVEWRHLNVYNRSVPTNGGRPQNTRQLGSGDVSVGELVDCAAKINTIALSKKRLRDDIADDEDPCIRRARSKLAACPAPDDEVDQIMRQMYAELEAIDEDERERGIVDTGPVLMPAYLVEELSVDDDDDDQ